MSLTLFLDLDGVVHPDAAYRTRTGEIVLKGPGSLFMHAEALAEALLPFPVPIVLSSSWVGAIGLQKTKARLPTSISARIIGGTYERRRHRRWSELSRYTQIAQWTRERAMEDWIAIDDAIEGWPQTELHRLIATNSGTGLTQADLDALATKLRTWRA